MHDECQQSAVSQIHQAYISCVVPEKPVVRNGWRFFFSLLGRFVGSDVAHGFGHLVDIDGIRDTVVEDISRAWLSNGIVDQWSRHATDGQMARSQPRRCSGCVMPSTAIMALQRQMQVKLLVYSTTRSLKCALRLFAHVKTPT